MKSRSRFRSTSLSTSRHAIPYHAMHSNSNIMMTLYLIKNVGLGQGASPAEALGGSPKAAYLRLGFGLEGSGLR